MKRASLLSLALMLALLILNAPFANSQGTPKNPLGRALFTINLPYEIDAAGVTIPAGEYVVRDMGVDSQNLLSITCPDQFESVALIHTTRRQLVVGREGKSNPRLVFQDENTSRPILREIQVPGLDDYIVIAAVANGNSRCAVTPTPATLSVTTRVEQPAPEPAPPAPAPEPEPAPAPQPEVTPPAPEPEPTPAPPPIQERKRVRKG